MSFRQNILLLIGIIVSSIVFCSALYLYEAPIANAADSDFRRQIQTTTYTRSLLTKTNAAEVVGSLGVWTQSVKLTNYTVLATENGTWFSNSGATNSVTNSLPAAVPGLHFSLVCVTAQTMAAKGNGTDTIRNAASVSGAGGILYSSTIGNAVHLVCPVAGAWYVDGVVGTWALQ